MLFVTVLAEAEIKTYNRYNPEIVIDCGDNTDVEYVKLNVSGINVPSNVYILEKKSVPYHMDQIPL